jgi:ATP synthase protein I
MPKLSLPKPPKAARLPPRPGVAAAGNLLACVLVGMLLGWAVDELLSSTPWGLLVGLGLGFAAWLRELWRLLKLPPQA